MDSKQFDICLVFHLGLIRSRPHDKTIDNARAINKHDADYACTLKAGELSAAMTLIEALESRFINLSGWIDSGPCTKRMTYNLNNSRNPSAGAFVGAFDVMANGTGIGKAAKANNVNYQSIKVLIPRLKRWDEFAKRLHETL